MGSRMFITANVPVCKGNKKDKKYLPSYLNSISANGQNGAVLSLQLKTGRDGKMSLCQKSMGMNGACKKDLTEKDITVGPAFISVENSLQRTIEYAGKSGSQLKFFYSEFQQGMARDAFNREFEIDISEGNTIAYKGAVLEIIEATNSTITYKVVRHFQ